MSETEKILDDYMDENEALRKRVQELREQYHQALEAAYKYEAKTRKLQAVVEAAKERQRLQEEYKMLCHDASLDPEDYDEISQTFIMWEDADRELDKALKALEASDG